MDDILKALEEGLELPDKKSFEKPDLGLLIKLTDKLKHSTHSMSNGSTLRRTSCNVSENS